MLPRDLQKKWAAQAKAKRRKQARLPPFTPNRQTINSLNKAELKSFDTSLAFSFDATGEVPATGQLSLIQQGDGLANRDGATVMVKSLQIRASWRSAPAAATTSSGSFYLYVVLDRQANGAAAAVTDVLTSSDMSVALGNVPNQFRFKILKRIVVSFEACAGVTTAYNTNNGVIDEYIKFKKPLQLRFTGNAGTVGDLASNNLFLLAGATSSVDDQVTLAGTARLRFTG